MVPLSLCEEMMMFVLAFCQLFEEQNEKVKDKMVEERQHHSQSFLSSLWKMVRIKNLMRQSAMD
jgi:hypothetical protein